MIPTPVSHGPQIRTSQLEFGSGLAGIFAPTLAAKYRCHLGGPHLRAMTGFFVLASHDHG
jgi:hypothetical protein